MMFQQLRANALTRLINGDINRAEYEQLLADIARLEAPAQPPVNVTAPTVNPDDGLASLVTRPRAVVPLEPPRLTAGMLIGKYRLESGQRGGMAEVWKATDTKSSSQRLVALKFLSPLLAGNDDEMARIRATFDLVEKLDHPHICRVFDLDESPQFGWYQVMRWINGRTFSRYRREAAGLEAVLPLETVCRLIEPVAVALDHAHVKGVLHRDIKPGNLMIDEDGHVSVIDFGLAAEVRGSLSRVSRNSVDLAGTEPYFAPELWRGQYPTKFSDLYALGVTAYELLTGRVPFPSDSSLILMQATLNEAIPKVDGLSESVQQVLVKCLSKTPAERFADCQAFVKALRDSCQDRPRPNVSTTPPSAQSDKAKPIATPVVPAASDSAKQQRNSLGSGTKAGERVILQVSGLDIAFRWCPAGKFQMGSPKHETGRSSDEEQVPVELTKGFWMQETTVTQALWKAVMKTEPWKGQTDIQEGELYPATYVPWTEANSFCSQLTDLGRKQGVLSATAKIVLPTEARWEYGCRAGTTTAYSFGIDASQLEQYAWFGISGSSPEAYAHPVGKKQPNPWGLLDVHGNVWEWCSDWYVNKLPGGRDPQGPPSGSSRVLRGGSWNIVPVVCRSSYRRRLAPVFHGFNIGFRCVVEL